MTHTDNVNAMRAIHAYNRSHYRSTPVQTNDTGRGWTGAMLIDTEDSEWLIEIANGDRRRLDPRVIRMSMGR